MNPNGINLLDLESSTLQAADVKAKRSRSISAWEDVLVHEKTPYEIFVLPALSQTSDLNEKDSVIIEHIMNLFHEGCKMSNTNMLSHLETCDLVVAASWEVWVFRQVGDVAIVEIENA